MIDPNAFTKMMPGLDFMQKLLQGAGQAMPTMGQWVAPTLDPAEIEKRINDLKAVHFWLEQNARLIATTIQALEVQRMTLSTLQTMNLPLTALREAMTLPVAAAAPARARAAAAPPAPAPMPAPPAAAATAGEPPAAQASGETTGGAARPAIDAMQWWGALTRQFAELATKAMQDSSSNLAKNLAAATTAAKPAAKAAAARPKPAGKKPAKRAAARKSA